MPKIIASQFVTVLTCVSLLYQKTLLKCLKPYSKLKIDYLIQTAGFHFIACHVDHYTRERNTENLHLIKFLVLKIKISVYELTSYI